ncbi:unnamed protein product, partial [Oncorhynchus mykiss]
TVVYSFISLCLKPEMWQKFKGAEYFRKALYIFCLLVEKESPVGRSGVLIAEPYSWKSLLCQLPVLHIQTTSCKAALLVLPPGRHVLCIHTRAPLGYHVHLYSMAPFIFGDEETVMPHLDKESVRFCEQALSILRPLGRVVSSFSDELELPAATRALGDAHCPAQLSTVGGLRDHQRVGHTHTDTDTDTGHTLTHSTLTLDTLDTNTGPHTH